LLTGFGDVRTVELLGREYDVESRELQRDLGVEQPRLTSRWKREARDKAKRKRKHVDTDANGDEGNGGGVAADLESLEPMGVVAAHPRQEAQHHTGYLTFARLVPYASKEAIAAAREAGKTRSKGGDGGYEEAELSE
jgi:tRNA (adenine57-N1/adenine58-N1)-methyltransferase